MDLTILAINVDDAQFNAPFAGGSEEGAATDTDDDDDAASGRRFDPRALVVLVILAGLAVLAKYLRSSDGVEVEVDDDRIEVEEA